MSNTETYEKVTASILALIEKGDLLPWQKSWKGTNEFARSMSTGKLYTGVNRWVLTLTAQAKGWSPWFGTYKQIEALGGQVRKGEKSSLAVLAKRMSKEDRTTGEVKNIFFLKGFAIFSASQADGLPEKYYSMPEPTDNEVVADAQEVFDTYVTAENIGVHYGGDEAYYRPAADTIQLPHLASFDSSDYFYATAFHEAGHSTGAAKRLNRPGVADFDAFGSHQYSSEELVAELSSSLVLGVLGIDKPNVVENQAAYLKHWQAKLASDPKAFVWAAGRAEKAANLILGVEEVKQEEEAAA